MAHDDKHAKGGAYMDRYMGAWVPHEEQLVETSEHHG
jgi:hypothetical protein